MPLQPKFGRFTTASPVLVNFDRVDIANGTGYEDYFLIESEQGGSKDYHLTPNNDFSNSEAIQKDGTGSIDEDFDLTPFVFARTINGIALFSIAIDQSGDSPSGVTCTIELYKVHEGVETQIGSTVAVTPDLSDPVGPRMLYLRMPLVNELIPAGDSLRLRVLLANPSQTLFFGIDPAGRTHGSLTITTTSKISVPFELDA